MTGESNPNPIDWSAEWARIYAQSSNVMRKSNKPAYWEKRANRFNKINNDGAGRVQAILKRIGVDDQTTVLDVGCGPGKLAIPLAKSAQSVTALDPAAAMLEKLNQRAAKEGMTNIRTINKDWNTAVADGDVVPHDIILSSYSLIMDNVGEALATMDTMAQKAVCLFWFANREGFGYDKFWPKLHGEEFRAGPDHTILLNILKSMGIKPEVTIDPRQHVISYDSMDQAVECWVDDLYVSSTDEVETVRSVLEEILTTRSGKPALVRNMQSAMIWWRK